MNPDPNLISPGIPLMGIGSRQDGISLDYFCRIGANTKRFLREKAGYSESEYHTGGACTKILSPVPQASAKKPQRRLPKRETAMGKNYCSIRTKTIESW